MVKITSDQYSVLAAAYDPKLHGTQKAYCQSLGINYDSFRNFCSRKRRKAGIPARPRMNYQPFLEEFENCTETIAEFCHNRNLNERNFRMALYRHGYRISEDDKRKKEELKTKKAAWWESIFSGENAFCQVVSRKEKSSW